MSIIEHIFRIIAPHSCVGCGKEGVLLCTACAQELPAVPATPTTPPLLPIQAATEYTGIAKKLIHCLKFERANAAAEDIAALMAQRLVFPEGAIVTHVPTVPARVRARGYDQAQLIAKAVARRAQLPYVPLLARSGQQRQVGQGRAARLQQMRGAFSVSRPAAATGRHIIIVDDVITTGSTCAAAATALLAAGAEHVEAAAFAAAP
ncbi:MAG TPA: phosphoribosyltransferase family protein [Candidatus Saccharimonadales bacterium]|nr:phosphoribosyltransferase family protein [Candidatus Saccharimonadales bacterium]